ncbi:hypothetical protein BUE93_20360 [Chromobacterium amazonense]|uniref:Type II/III secretion system secretin-like domain-containing protein n=1 Tax=Chromobacterium amazonense TaxID=1382803 RepID=A0A2S9WZA3_9NEIS|nr:hypothetical protein [Chromobacterium amazonense]PRP68802.1 hypothetical protein BUE93_20360 [Chromobacterium amazonense]
MINKWKPMVLVCLLAGCAAPAKEQVKNRLQQGIDEASRPRVEAKLVETAKPYLRAQSADYNRPAGGGVTLSVERAPMLATLRSLAQQAGYELSVTGALNSQAPVSVSFRQLDAESALREVSFAGGAVAIVDKTRHIVTIAPEGLYTFRIPVGVLKTKKVESSVTNSLGSSASGSGSEGGGSGGGGGSNATGDNAVVTVAGEHGYTVEAVVNHLRNILSEGASVSANTQVGVISVRGKAMDLRRARDFIETWLRDASTVVEVETTVLDVGLTDQFQFGIDWTKVLSGDTVGTVGITNAGLVENPSFSATLTRGSIKTVINALQQYTDVNVTVSEQARANNHSAQILTNAKQVPYLPSVTTNTTSNGGTSATVQASGSLAFTMEGSTFAVIPHVISNQYVDLTLVPLVARIDKWETFSLPGGTELKGPYRPVTSGYLNTTVETGRTVIIASSHAGTANKVRQGVPGLMNIPALGELAQGRNSRDEQRATVVLVRTHIVPAPRVDALIGESL